MSAVVANTARRSRALLAFVALAASAAALADDGAWSWSGLPHDVEPPAMPADGRMDASRIALGRQLFYEPALSLDGSLPCAACHQQARGFTDGLARHVGVSGEMGKRNVPGLANVAWRSSLTWTDPAVTTLEQQAMIPMAGDTPVEMGMHGQEAVLIGRLTASDCYKTMFARAFPEHGGRIDFATVTAALAAFQRTMLSFDSPHDRYLDGARSAMSPVARQGAASFKQIGCAQCHAGRDLTDNRFHYTGTEGMAETFGYGARKPRPGEVEQFASRFRTPSLRNVAITGPWMHDGASASMEDAIRRHAAAALIGVDMAPLLAFLEAQTDENFLRDPALAPPKAQCSVPAASYGTSGTGQRTH